jgi:outer membrane protein TolC
LFAAALRRKEAIMARLEKKQRRLLRQVAWLSVFGPVLGIANTAWADDSPSPVRIGYQDSKREVKLPGSDTPTAPPGKAEKTGTTQAPGTIGPPSIRPSAAGELGADAAILPIDLPYALRLVNASNPTIQIARERVRQALAELAGSRVLWIPNLWVGGNPDNNTFLPNFYVHRGNIQNARGEVFDTVKANAAFSLGTGFNLSVSDAVFAPRISRNLAAAEEARSRVITYNVQLDVALTYLDLLEVYGALAINAEMISKVELMLNYATQADRGGFGKTTADVNRARTEYETRRRERIDLFGRAAVVSARLAQLLLLEATADLVPGDIAVLPIELTSVTPQINELVAVGLMNRPELSESRSQTAAALEAWRQDKSRPLFPNLGMAYYGAEFGGGMPGIHDYNSRGDFLFQASWQLRNAGLGNLYQTRAARSRLEQTSLHVTEVSAQVAADVAAAVKLVRARQRSLDHAQEAVGQAEEMWTRLSKAAFGIAGPAEQYDPLEPLLAEQALNEARNRYLSEVIDYNRSQFRLYWAMGQPPEESLAAAQALPLKRSVLPSASSMAPPSSAPIKLP